MALHFAEEEYAARLARLTAKMQEEKLDAVLLFAQESMYWLTGYDTFGYCFFQTLVVKRDGSMVLLTRSADLRQARHTSNIERIEIWVDRVNADPAMDLKNLLSELDLLGCRIGVEYDTHGMTGKTARLVDHQLSTFGELVDASLLVSRLRLIKSPAEIAHVEKAASLADDALDATLEWAGVSAHYHAAMMRTIVIGEPTNRHRELYSACRETIQAIEMVLRPGNTFGTVFDVHAKIMDERGLARHRLNACGYSLGARFSPSWMEHQMFHVGNPQEIEPDMSLFVHMIIMDSDSGTAMTLGQTYLTTADTPRPLSRYGLDFISA
ncbi:Xaa-Pro dipeptidase [Sinorhizobium medicae]|nr:Xaa-Pro dipeptidase [Sinorhizobium medicae]